jgi:putative membrane protein
MIAAGYDISLNPDPWRFQLHLEVWLLMVALIAGYVYAVRVIGPKVAPEGNVVSRRQVIFFSLMISVMWLSTDWPIHDIAEEYLYSVHMVQHMSLTMFVPPLALLSTPEWLFRLIIGEGRVRRATRFMVRPAAAALTYNVMLMVSHIPQVVNLSASNGPVHYLVHVVLVMSAFIMWIPICSPAHDWRVSDGAKMIYLFSMSLVPTIPAGWLTFAENPVYRHYDTPVRVWGVNVLSDQQAAGGIMKLGGSVFMWIVIIFIFFKRFMGGFYRQQSYSRVASVPDAEVTGTDEPLTFDQVEAAFSRTRPAPENPQTPA